MSPKMMRLRARLDKLRAEPSPRDKQRRDKLALLKAAIWKEELQTRAKSSCEPMAREAKQALQQIANHEKAALLLTLRPKADAVRRKKIDEAVRKLLVGVGREQAVLPSKKKRVQ